MYGRIEVCLRVGATDTYADPRPNAMAVDVAGCAIWIASSSDLDRYDAARVRPR